MFGLGNMNIASLMNIDLGKVLNQLLISGAVYLAKKHNIPLDEFQGVIRVHEVQGKNGEKVQMTVIYASDSKRKVYEKMTTFELAKAIKGDGNKNEGEKQVEAVKEN